jgi:hypothetical protein
MMMGMVALAFMLAAMALAMLPSKARGWMM